MQKSKTKKHRGTGDAEGMIVDSPTTIHLNQSLFRAGGTVAALIGGIMRDVAALFTESAKRSG